MAAKTFDLYNNHLPIVQPGEYEVTYDQDFQFGGVLKNQSQQLKFRIEGIQSSIDPQLVEGVFPPAGLSGVYDIVLPHIVINRSTIPWERKVSNGKSTTPWLALLLVTEDELTINQTKSGEVPITHVTYKGSKRLSSIFPTNLLEAELNCHVRIEGQKEVCVLISKAKPNIGKKNILHLVSIENAFDSNGNLNSTTFQSYYNWTFFCQEHFRFSKEVIYRHKLELGDATVKGTLANSLLDFEDQEFFSWDEFEESAKPRLFLPKEKELIIKYFDLGHLIPILKHLDKGYMRRLIDGSPTQEEEAGYFNMGYITVDGKKKSALYRSPLSPLPVGSIAFSIQKNADYYYRTIGKLPEISLASAWELGKLLCLQNKRISTNLFTWKKEHYHKFRINPGAKITAPPDFIKDWFENLANLEGVPFHYLVPEENMLPYESIRFFYIDQNWINSLLDGAFSVARITNDEVMYDQKLQSELMPAQLPEVGFIIRSVAVPGWPDLIVEGDGVLPMKKTNLGEEINLYLFEKPISAYTIHAKPEMLHFVAEDDNGNDLLSNAYKQKDSSHFASAVLANLDIVKFNV